jgi:hypothetical protein
MESVVLLDLPTEASGEFDRSFLERLGHDVTVCHGPDVRTLCPLLGGRACEKFEEAHGVVFSFDLGRPQHRAILARYRELGRPDLPIRVVTDAALAARYADELTGVTVWTHQPTAGDLDGLAAEVEAADRAN